MTVSDECLVEELVIRFYWYGLFVLSFQEISLQAGLLLKVKVFIDSSLMYVKGLSPTCRYLGVRPSTA